MPQFVNEYEGFGNALIKLGAQYYADSERKEEEKRRKQELLEAEERRRTEKLEDRKYAEEQAEIAYKRTAPLETLKLEAARLKAEREKAELTRPRTSGVGNTIIQQKPKFGEDGSFAGWEESRSVAAPRSSAPRSNAARTVTTNGRVMQFNDATQAYDKDIGAAGTGKGTAQKDPLDQGMALMDNVTKLRTMASELGEGHPDKAAFTQQANELEGTGKALMQEGMRRMKEGPAPKQSTSSGVWDALGAGFKAATQYGRSESDAAAAGMEGAVPPQVAADTLAAMTGSQTDFAGAKGKPNATGASKKRGALGSSEDNPVPVSSAAEVEALPDGTWVRTPKGTIRQK